MEDSITAVMNSTLLNATANRTEIYDPELEEMRSNLQNMRFVIQLVLVPIVMCIGVCGNTITIIVLTRKCMRSSTNYYLTALALSDMLYLVIFFVLSLKHHSGMNAPETYAYWHFYPFGLWIVDAASATSTWLTVTFTVERYIAVCHPIKGKAMCTPSRAKKVIIAVFVCCYTLTASTPYEWMVVESYDDTNTTYTLKIDYTDLGNNNVYRTVFYWFSAVVMILIPLVMLSVFNSFLINTVNRSRADRKKLSEGGPKKGNQNQENKITLMLIAVVALALVCQTPAAIALLYSSFVTLDYNTKGGVALLILGNLFNLMTACNAALNFILYCALSDKFRKIFMATFCERCAEPKAPLNYSCVQTTYTDVDGRISRASSVVNYSRRNSRSSDTSSVYNMSPTHKTSTVSAGGQYLTVPSTGGGASQGNKQGANGGEQNSPLLNKVNGDVRAEELPDTASYDLTINCDDSPQVTKKSSVLRFLLSLRKSRHSNVYSSRQSIVVKSNVIGQTAV